MGFMYRTVGTLWTSKRIEATQNGDRTECEGGFPTPFAAETAARRDCSASQKVGRFGYERQRREWSPGVQAVVAWCTWGSRGESLTTGRGTFVGMHPNDGYYVPTRCLHRYCAELPRFAELQASRLGALSVMVPPACMSDNLDSRLAWHIARAADGRVFRLGISCTTLNLSAPRNPHRSCRTLRPRGQVQHRA